MKLLSNLQIRQIKPDEFKQAMKILDNELKKRVRKNEFLFSQFQKFPKFFIGVFLDKEIVGVICGFPREDYLLISEIAVDIRFQKKGFGKKLVKAFEKNAKTKYKKINVGAQDDVIKFYDSLGYKPFLLIQFKKEDYTNNDFKDFEIIKKRDNVIEAKVKRFSQKLIKTYRKKYSKATFQYIFSKNL